MFFRAAEGQHQQGIVTGHGFSLAGAMRVRLRKRGQTALSTDGGYGRFVGLMIGDRVVSPLFALHSFRRTGR